MSTSFEIKSSANNYSVLIENGSFNLVLEQHRDAVMLVDEWFVPVLSANTFRTLALNASETTKNLESLPSIIAELRRIGAQRDTHLLAIGGGAIQDVAGFIASIYMRGLSWTYVPTTLLAMADSCIGGKSSINVGPYKNLVGTFYPPSRILVDPSLTSSLSTEQRVSGLIEACKICYCRGADTFKSYLDLEPCPNMSSQAIEHVLQLSLSSKKWFIETDEFDRAERLFLNFGHTFGHALEGASAFRITHGVAVGVGILCALRFGELLGRNYRNIARVLDLRQHVQKLLAELPDLPKELGGECIPDFLDRFAADKKHRSDSYSLILLRETGEVEKLQVPRTAASNELIEAAVRDVKGLITRGPIES